MLHSGSGAATVPVEPVLPGTVILSAGIPTNLGGGTNEDVILVVERSNVVPMRTHSCYVCSTPLEYKGTGRRPQYCSKRCKKRAERTRARNRPRVLSLSAPRERVLTRAEQTALLGREPYSGDWQGYLEATGRGLGGVPR
jgi:predicted nucleic acid-binding Zn ribbon protein